jgi:hypothetical protein
MELDRARSPLNAPLFEDDSDRADLFPIWVTFISCPMTPSQDFLRGFQTRHPI